jgi:hypothetical protein
MIVQIRLREKKMRGVKSILLALSVAAVCAPAVAQYRHHHTHASVGFVFGAPAYGPYYGPAPYPYYPYYYPPVIAVPASPPVYIERGPTDAGSENFWYYCANPQGYYPYVRECRTNWQRVTPTPQGN